MKYQPKRSISSTFLKLGVENDVTLDELKEKISTLLTQEVKQIITNIPKDTGIFIMHFNQLIGEIGQYIRRRLEERLASRFGIIATDVLISDIRYNEGTDSYERLVRITEKQAHKFNLELEKTALLSHKSERAGMVTDSVVRNVTALEMTRIQLKNAKNLFARARKEGQRAMKRQTESAGTQADLASQTMYMDAHTLNQETEAKKSAFSALRKSGLGLLDISSIISFLYRPSSNTSPSFKALRCSSSAKM